MRGAGGALFLVEAAGLRRGVTVDVDREDGCAFAGVEHRRRLAVAPAWSDRAGAGDENDLVLHASCHGAISICDEWIYVRGAITAQIAGADRKSTRLNSSH